MMEITDMSENAVSCRKKSQCLTKILEVRSFYLYIQFIEDRLMFALEKEKSEVSKKEFMRIYSKGLKCFFKNKPPKTKDKNFNSIIWGVMRMLAISVNYFCPNQDIMDIYYQTMLVFDRCFSKCFNQEIQFKRLKASKIEKSFSKIRDTYIWPS